MIPGRCLSLVEQRRFYVSRTLQLVQIMSECCFWSLDSTGRFCLSGSSGSMIRLWDLGQQRCLHTYAVHTDSVWALACTPSFSHVYSGGRDQCLYLTDLATRESVLLCTKEHPIHQLALQDNSKISINRFGGVDDICLVSLLQDAAGSVKLWDITMGVVVEDYGKASMELRLIL